MTWRRSKNKMGNVASACQQGHSHRSKLESAVCGLIHLRERAGELKLVQAECNVHLSRAKILYIADFKCVDLKTGEDIYIEAKGMVGPRWPTIKKLWKAYGLGRLEVWRGTHTRPYLDEVIEPVGGEDG